ncbi:MAG: hypothetical protein M1813_008562 [Trichoglossum hirsutum]|jgi:hypothetical protein|nr:MAG: hypothetical protein M1813_008562 [Trichoglossum hirsutum]
MPRRPSQESLHSLEANVGTLAMAGGAVAAINEAQKAIEGDSVKHGIHAGLGAAAIAAGYGMVKDATRDDMQDDKPNPPPDGCSVSCRHNRAHRSSSTCSDKSYESRNGRHHLLHLAEEAAGAWAVAKRAMGDKDHKKTHFVEEVLGAVGLYEDAKDHRKSHVDV